MKKERGKFCPGCGKELKEKDKYCISCGYSFEQRGKKKDQNIKTKNIIILAIILILAWLIVRKFTNQPLVPDFLLKLWEK